MNNLELHLMLIGGLLFVLSFLHVFVGSYANWKEELPRLNLLNRQMVKTHTFFIALLLLLLSLLLLSSHDLLLNSLLGKRIAIGLAVFWGTRLLFQFFVYSSRLWKGKLFETIIHVLASLFWLYMTVVFVFVAIS